MKLHQYCFYRLPGSSKNQISSSRMYFSWGCYFISLMFSFFSAFLIFSLGNYFVEIWKKERDVAQKRYGDESYERLKESLAFGSRVPTKDSIINEFEGHSNTGFCPEKSAQRIHPGIYVLLCNLLEFSFVCFCP